MPARSARGGGARWTPLRWEGARWTWLVVAELMAASASSDQLHGRRIEDGRRRLAAPVLAANDDTKKQGEAEQGAQGLRWCAL
jgi:hypothetical protein